MRRICLIINFFIITSISFSFCACNYNEKITIKGSTALQPLGEKVAQYYYNKGIILVISGGGSGQGLNSIINKTCNIGASDIAPEEINYKNDSILDNKICTVGIAIIVGKGINLNNNSMTIDDLKAIYFGEKTNWNTIKGCNVNHSIDVYYRKAGTGTRTLFELYALGLKPKTLLSDFYYSNLGGNYARSDTTQELKNAIKNDPYGIGYETFPYLEASSHVINIDGVRPTYANINNGKYNLWGYEHMYTNKNSNKGQNVINYMLNYEFHNVIREYKYGVISEMNEDVKNTRDSLINSYL